MKSIELLSLSYYSPDTWSIAVLRLSNRSGDRALFEVERTFGFFYVSIGFYAVCGAKN